MTHGALLVRFEGVFETKAAQQLFTILILNWFMGKSFANIACDKLDAVRHILINEVIDAYEVQPGWVDGVTDLAFNSKPIQDVQTEYPFSFHHLVFK